MKKAASEATSTSNVFLLIISLVIYFTPFPSIDYIITERCDIAPDELPEFSYDLPEVMTCEKLEELRISLKSDKAAAQQRKEAAEEAKRKELEELKKREAEKPKQEKAAEEAKRKAEEEEVRSRRVVHPVNYEAVYTTSPYDENRGDYYHDGIDFGVDLRPDIQALAATTGVITFAGDTSQTPYPGCGRMVAIYHPTYDVTTVYCHLDSISVFSGDSVNPGSPIGIIGSTGMSTGIHLHFMTLKGREIFNRENLYNPTEFLSFID